MSSSRSTYVSSEHPPFNDAVFANPRSTSQELEDQAAKRAKAERSTPAEWRSLDSALFCVPRTALLQASMFAQFAS
eukprot:9500605-Pyramimonas_sp.AAC.3